MATGMPLLRPLSCWKSILRTSRKHKAFSRCLMTSIDHTSPASNQASLTLPPPIVPTPMAPTELKKIKIYPPPPSATKLCKEPLKDIHAMQIAILDPSSARTELFSKTNPEAAKVGDILLVRQKDGDPFAGVCISIRRRGVDTAILLRNELTRVGVEMWYKVYSPNVEGIEVVQRKEKRARRARLTYLRKPKHDMGSLQNIVMAYQRTRASFRSDGSKGREKSFGKKKKKKGKK